MKVIGLTGGSGSGKSLVAAALLENGVNTLDTDAVYHRLISENTPCTEEIVGHFGEIVRAAGGGIDRAALRGIVMADGQRETALPLLNSITHKYVLEACRGWLAAQESGGAALAAIDAPQLFESGFDRECDAVIAVIAPKEMRVERILLRDGITQKEAEQRILAQKEDEFFRTHADFVILNDQDKEKVRKEVVQILSALL